MLSNALRNLFDWVPPGLNCCHLSCHRIFTWRQDGAGSNWARQPGSQGETWSNKPKLQTETLSTPSDSAPRPAHAPAPAPPLPTRPWMRDNTTQIRLVCVTVLILYWETGSRALEWAGRWSDAMGYWAGRVPAKLSLACILKRPYLIAVY